jgi:hypothetical protein
VEAAHSLSQPVERVEVRPAESRSSSYGEGSHDCRLTELRGEQAQALEDEPDDRDEVSGTVCTWTRPAAAARSIGVSPRPTQAHGLHARRSSSLSMTHPTALRGSATDSAISTAECRRALARRPMTIGLDGRSTDQC